ncbi:hypothetical protein HYZ99_02740, partial [Candidatus Peregrinibacteria bacterium]|nr:hypothetical protein [Candidatus Peregrinibacteria bacterium]
MEYKNVERDNLRLDLIQVWERRPNCRIAVADIPSGSGTVTISPPNDPDRAAELVISLRSTGEHKSPYITLTTSSYKVTSAPSGSFELPEFSVTRVIAAPPAPVETPVAAAPVPIEEPIASEQGLRLDLMDVSATPSESALWNNAMALQQRWNTFNASGNYADGQVPGAKWVESQV